MTPNSRAVPAKLGGGGQEAGGTVSTRHGIVVLDFGGQYTQLIARRIREQQVFSAILPCTASVEEIRALEPAGIVLSGGPSSVYDATAPVCDPKVLQLDIPVLGICYGMHWLTHTLGGKVERAERREYGPAQLDIESDSKLFSDCPGKFKIWNSHGDHVVGLPEGFTVTGRTDNAVGAVEHIGKRFYGARIPSRSESHRTRHGNSEQLCVSGVRRKAELGSRRVHRVHGRYDSQTGGGRPRDLRS